MGSPAGDAPIALSGPCRDGVKPRRTSLVQVQPLPVGEDALERLLEPRQGLRRGVVVPLQQFGVDEQVVGRVEVAELGGVRWKGPEAGFYLLHEPVRLLLGRMELLDGQGVLAREAISAVDEPHEEVGVEEVLDVGLLLLGNLGRQDDALAFKQLGLVEAIEFVALGPIEVGEDHGVEPVCPETG